MMIIMIYGCKIENRECFTAKANSDQLGQVSPTQLKSKEQLIFGEFNLKHSKALHKRIPPVRFFSKWNQSHECVA